MKNIFNSPPCPEYQTVDIKGSPDPGSTFDDVAPIYDKTRPACPPQLVEDIRNLTQLSPDAPLLEIGCGTGQLSVSLAALGNPLTCIEPGPRLAAIAIENLRPFPAATVVTTTFEQWKMEQGNYAMVISAQAFHWVDPSIAFQKSAQALRPSGHIALIWNRPIRIGLEIENLLDEAYQRHAPEISERHRKTTLQEWIGKRCQEMDSSGLFAPCAAHIYPWSRTQTTAEHLALMSTFSDHRLLPEVRRNELFREVHDTIERSGGNIERHYWAILFLAQKRQIEF